MTISQQAVYICATSRLARGMQLRAQVAYTKANQKIWQSIEACTLSQWLNSTLEAAMMLGQVPVDAMPAMLLNGFSETHLWEAAITQCLDKHAASALFDVKSLAKTAMSAHQTLIEWQVPESDINHASMSQEARQFLRWRHTFIALCAQKNSLDTSTYLAKQIALVCEFESVLPSHIIFAGFDRVTPLMQILLTSLKSKNVAISFENDAKSDKDNDKSHIACVGLQDVEAECRAAVAWAKAQLTQNPNAQIALISPTLREERAYLADLLDDAFHVESLLPHHYEAPRIYDFSLGLALNNYPIINTALQLLRLAATPQARSFDVITPILHDVYWGDLAELPMRALLDAHLRQKVSAEVTLKTMTHVAESHFLKLQSIQTERNEHQLTINAEDKPHYLRALLLLDDFTNQQPKKQHASAWLAAFLSLLTELNWATTRALSSVEYQTQQRFLAAIQTLAQQDFILGPLSAHECLSALTTMCQQSMFQPESVGEVHIQLLGLLETPALKLDAVWVMHMNDQHWPPAVKLNPLLPVKLQRDLALPNASAAVQTEFARIVQARVNQMADTVVFSYALKSRDQTLRPSTLLADLPQMNLLANPEVNARVLPVFTSLAEQLATPVSLAFLDDHIANEVADVINIRGGTQLFARQAICPAWAFYQYRLGAKALETPTDGMDSKDHGNLLHKALEQFWLACTGSVALNTMTDETLQTAIAAAIQKAINIWQEKAAGRVSAQVLRIEAAQMQGLMTEYLAIEKMRAEFVVEACEKTVNHTIAGIPLTLTIDRIDCLVADGFTGQLAMIDYKTGSQVSHNSWALPRITEPQLPIYATLAMQTAEIAAVYFAKLNVDALKMIGLAKTKDIVPGLAAFDSLKSHSPFLKFTSWQDLLNAWQQTLTAIGEEITRGEARVTFKKASDLTYCEVLPLLRLPERLHQFEQVHLQHTVLDDSERA